MIEPAEPLPYDEAFDASGNGSSSGHFYSLARRMRTDEPRNHGVPWTDAQHEQLVERVRAGDDTEQIAEAVGRKPAAVTTRLRRLLPPDNRDHPSDLVLTVAREYLGDAAAEWRVNLLRSTVPRPVITPPPVMRTGLGGIDDDDLVVLAYALIAAQGSGQPDLLDRLVTEVQDRGLEHRVVALRVRELRYQPGCALTDGQLVDVAFSWLWQASRPEDVDRRFRTHWHDPAYGY